mmetsp:Transcript_10529/g.21659  ORF Transcript_10529/g.21659 Transcript_10529/m.21659 type:complete len:146 (-) Transcript_10529:209-646(-)|eukprot:CAMPEP_0172469336 /NCGR_PEP_ID=MMETSP1065-20121228/63504_1 /TAXON_ID=265537 /ORGANISM="Amphiprora paludosa, Strain CCMP125" /LENGTH=145 /DNA_ID=CAMNT_0013226985 /DNA_START=136 /DNA_END=573 /DNA_ORIENTATION=+
MIRSCRIPAVLNRVCDESVPSALLVTFEGEILGESTAFPHHKDASSFGTLVADIASDYQRAGEDYASIDGNQNINPGQEPQSKSHMQCLIIEMDSGCIGVSACAGVDCFVIAVAKPQTPMGLLKGRLLSLASFVQESMSTLAETS